jgi:phospholipid/cholesterol/gamma-HCH transport system ATP-binding protein
MARESRDGKPAAETVVELQGVKKTYGTQKVLRGVDLKVYRRETLVIIGRSGTGKSVSIRHIIGLEQPDEGRVVVFGKDLAGMRRSERDAMRLKMGYLFQSGALLNWMTIAENVELPLVEHRRKMPAAERRARVIEKLRLVEMEDARDKFPAEISGGMKKRAALARAVILDPAIILYDEPTSGLDPVIASTINDLIVQTGKTLETTQVVVTHDMESAYKIGHRIAMLYEGKIIAEGTPGEIQKTENPIVRQFIHGETRGPITQPNPLTG